MVIVFCSVRGQVEKTVCGLHEKLEVIEHQQTRTGTLRTIRTLASHHLIPVLTTFLGYPLPYDE